MLNLSKSQLFGLVFIGIVIVAAIVYFTTSFGNEVGQTNRSTAATTTSTETSAAEVSNSTVSSPISPISPVPTVDTRELDPEEADRRVQEGISLYESGQYEAAIEVFNDLLARNPIDIVAHNGRGSAYMALDEMDKALADFSAAINLEPIFPFAYYNRGRVYIAQGRYDDAVTDLKRSIELAPDEFGYRANGNIGLAYFYQGNYDQALQAFEESISFDDTKADAYYHRGETHAALEDYEAAIADYRSALERFPRYDEALQALGFAYYKTGNMSEARRAIDQALAISSNSSTAHFYLGLIELAEEHPDLAKEAFSVAADTIDSLSAEDEKLVLTQVSTELERFSQENPDQSQEIEALFDLLPQS